MTMNSDEARRTIESLNAVGSPVERQVRRLQSKLDKRDKRIAGLERRVAELEREVTTRTGDLVLAGAEQLRRDIEKSVTRALCNVRMIPVLDIGGHRKIVEVRTSDA